MKDAYDLIVLGAGSGGLVSAELGAKLGAKVALIDKSPEALGGQALHTACVPSKVFLHMAKRQRVMWKSIRKEIRSVADELREMRYNPEIYTDLGVDIFYGTAQLIDEKQIKVGRETLSYKKLVIATGSSPRIPAIPGLKDMKYETNETIFQLEKLPKSLAILGGGPVACELAATLRRLKVETHIIEHNGQLLHDADGEASEWVRDALEEAGVLIHTSASVTSVRKKGAKKLIALNHGNSTNVISVESILVATGRKANVPGGAKKQEIRLEDGAILVNEKWQTTNSDVYAIGDCTKFDLNFTHASASAAVDAVRHALLGVRPTQDISNQPFVFFTESQVARAGPSVTELDREGIWHHVYQIPFGAVDKALIEGERGFIKVSTDRRGRVIGATIVGRGAGELIGYFALALDKRMKLADMADFPLPYPTFSYGIKDLARQAYLDSLAKRTKLTDMMQRLGLR